ncbi:hypothetical protein SAMN05421856_105192 [Chryseobacterium taichungense]|uniref:Uncharacterized protein n=1 Tax=Chryseobacterium taichungense TaxID=295069 RepID=A0A1H8A8G0_9FLAO|nr:hypothetical protein SAMN05421856_105192 [Chryseobacterium taichungense]
MAKKAFKTKLLAKELNIHNHNQIINNNYGNECL